MSHGPKDATAREQRSAPEAPWSDRGKPVAVVDPAEPDNVDSNQA